MKKNNDTSFNNDELLNKIINLQLHHNTRQFNINVEADLVQLKYYMEMKSMTLDDEPPKFLKKEHKKWEEEIEYYNYKIKKYEEEFKFDSKELEDNIRLLSSMN